MIITIDGPAGTGKTTVAYRLAKRLQFVYFDTGAMYRSFTWYVLQKKCDLDDEKKVRFLLNSFSFDVLTDEMGTKKYLVNRFDVTKAIREEDVTNHVSKVAAIGLVRKCLVRLQREFSKDHNVVFEGRDMGTVVFPKADIKIFLTANPNERAKRRCREMQEKFPNKSFDQKRILQDIQKRDFLDSNRAISPLTQAKDAFLVDTTSLSIDDVIDQILLFGKKKLKKFYKEKRKDLPRLHKMRWVYRIVYSWAWLVMKIFYRHKVYGKKHLLKGAAFLAVNHTSYLDPLAIAAACPEEVHFLAKGKLFDIPILKTIMRILNTHPISGEATDKNTFRLTKNLLQEHKKVVLFPEGTRAFSEEIGPFLPGLGFLAHMTQSRVIPLYIHGAYKAWNRNHRFPRPFGKIICVFGSAIDIKKFTQKDKKEKIALVNERVRQALIDLQKWCKDGCQGTPP